MANHEVVPFSQPVPPEWDMESILHGLGGNGQYVNDVAFGEGAALPLGDAEPLSVELFPGPQVVRLTSADAQISLYRVAPTSIDERGVIFQSHPDKPQGVWALVDPMGHVTVSIISPGQSGSEAQQTAAAKPESPQAAAALAEKEPRQVYTGRVGAAPTFRTTPRGTFIGQFILGTHEDSETTTWRKVLAFGDRARRLQASELTRGQQVEVVGYLHERQARSRDGGNKLVQEIYAVAVRAR